MVLSSHELGAITQIKRNESLYKKMQNIILEERERQRSADEVFHSFHSQIHTYMIANGGLAFIFARLFPNAGMWVLITLITLFFLGLSIPFKIAHDRLLRLGVLITDLKRRHTSLKEEVDKFEDDYNAQSDMNEMMFSNFRIQYCALYGQMVHAVACSCFVIFLLMFCGHTEKHPAEASY